VDSERQDGSRSANSVTLRPLSIRDAEMIAGWATDTRFCHEAGWNPALSLSEHQRFHRRLIESPPADLIRLGVIHDGVLVGYVDLHGEEPHRREIGFVIGERQRWGRGIGSRAAVAGLDYGFTTLGLQQIWAEVLDANLRAIRIMQRLGFVDTGRGDEGRFVDQPSYYRQFALSRREIRAPG
jgi:RimJ/RimL family protein N-acetyltransferase